MESGGHVDLTSFLVANWALVAANPTTFIVLAVLAFGAGWGVAYLFLKQSIAHHKDRADYWKERAEGGNGAEGTATPSVDFDYPAAGFHGLNILADTVPEIAVNIGYSMAAHVPDGKKLRLKMVGPAHENVSDLMGAWRFNTVLRNWVADRYDTDAHSQWFEAAPGDADLQFFASRAGTFHLAVYEGGREPSWTKQLRVTGRVQSNAPAAAMPTPVARPRVIFVPNDQQDRIVRILRQLDGQWLELSDLHKIMQSGSWQDTAEDVRALVAEGWLEQHPDNDLKDEGGHGYRLRGPGLAFAREQGYQTTAQLQQQQALQSQNLKRMAVSDTPPEDGSEPR